MFTVSNQMVGLHALREELGERQSRDRVILESVEHFDSIFFKLQYLVNVKTAVQKLVQIVERH